jgi:hypothetical protein
MRATGARSVESRRRVLAFLIQVGLQRFIIIIFFFLRKAQKRILPVFLFFIFLKKTSLRSRRR